MHFYQLLESLVNQALGEDKAEPGILLLLCQLAPSAYGSFAIVFNRTRISCGSLWGHRTACGFPQRKPHIDSLTSAALQEIREARGLFVVFSQGKPPLAIFIRPRNCETALGFRGISRNIDSSVCIHFLYDRFLFFLMERLRLEKFLVCLLLLS
jgi:hypothetical protein